MHPLVLLPGMNCTAELWAGTGLEGALTPDLDVPDMNGQVDRLLSGLPPTFVVVGLSLGAVVGIALAQRAPERVAGLCVMSVNAKAPTDVQRAGWQDWLDRLDAGESPRSLQRSVLAGLLSTDAAARPDLVERTLRMGDDTGADALRAQLQMQATRVDLRSGLRGLAIPMLVINGQRDVICPPAFHAEIVGAVARARSVSIDGGHLLALERPAEIGSLVRNWRRQSRI